MTSPARRSPGSQGDVISRSPTPMEGAILPDCTMSSRQPNTGASTPTNARARSMTRTAVPRWLDLSFTIYLRQAGKK